MQLLRNVKKKCKNETTQDSTVSNLLCLCGSSFQNNQGLSKHRKTCRVFLDQTSVNNNFTQGNRYILLTKFFKNLVLINYYSIAVSLKRGPGQGWEGLLGRRLTTLHRTSLPRTGILNWKDINQISKLALQSVCRGWWSEGAGGHCRKRNALL